MFRLTVEKDDTFGELVRQVHRENREAITEYPILMPSMMSC